MAERRQGVIETKQEGERQLEITRAIEDAVAPGVGKAIRITYGSKARIFTGFPASVTRQRGYITEIEFLSGATLYHCLIRKNVTEWHFAINWRVLNLPMERSPIVHKIEIIQQL